jgi:transcriptional regulator with XRE-family HTH domain
MLRAAFVSLFWSIISDLKEHKGLKLRKLADDIGVDKSSVSRWFSGNDPNWQLDTIADLANALNVEITVQATDRETQVAYTPQGKQSDVREPAQVETLVDEEEFELRNINPRIKIYPLTQTTTDEQRDAA